jgi:hypothetical protein
MGSIIIRQYTLQPIFSSKPDDAVKVYCCGVGSKGAGNLQSEPTPYECLILWMMHTPLLSFLYVGNKFKRAPRSFVPKHEKLLG